MPQQYSINFWGIKHAIDTEVARLGWSKQKAKAYIQQRYHKNSRLYMSDEELLNLLQALRNLS